MDKWMDRCITDGGGEKNRELAALIFFHHFKTFQICAIILFVSIHLKMFVNLLGKCTHV